MIHARSEDGKTMFEIIEHQDILTARPALKEHGKPLRTPLRLTLEDGSEVERIDATTFRIVVTGQIIRAR
jgi:hypothetical protein